MASITLKGREIPLLYTTYEMKAIQEEIAPLQEVIAKISGKADDDDNEMSLYGSPGQIEALGKMIRILGNAALEEAGEEPDLTDKKILRWMKPTEIVPAIQECVNAINEGNKSEIPEDEEKGPVDKTLEKLKKKDEKDG